jgi:DNA-directed RNA polymerase subunit alpha
MPEETRTVTAVEDICSQTVLDADAVFRLRNAVRKSTNERKALQGRLNALESENLSKDEKTLRSAVFQWLLGRLDEADATLQGASSQVARAVRGAVLLEKGMAEQAAGDLIGASSQSPKAAAELAAALRASGKIGEALEVLGRAEKVAPKDSDILIQKAWCLEAQGDQNGACAGYQSVLASDPGNPVAAFRLAYYMDLRGEDVKAIELYRSVAGSGAAFVNAMINLGLLYEDRDEVESAIACFKEALRADPTNRRAALYLRDSVESLDMYYDETQRKENDRLEAVLRIPINEFELSVRSRNCLAKMNVKSLGDMVRKTEPELLAYKNFGETSLREIKQLLESKGLRLGMQKEEEAKRVRAQRLRMGNGGTQENALLGKPVGDLELSVRSRKCMQRLNIETIGELVDRSEADLLATKNFGQTSLVEVKAKLLEMGLSLRAND